MCTASQVRVPRSACGTWHKAGRYAIVLIVQHCLWNVEVSILPPLPIACSANMTFRSQHQLRNVLYILQRKPSAFSSCVLGLPTVLACYVTHLCRAAEPEDDTDGYLQDKYARNSSSVRNPHNSGGEDLLALDSEDAENWCDFKPLV